MNRLVIESSMCEIEHDLCACTVDNPLAQGRGLSLHTGAQTMLYLTCTMISCVDLAQYGVSRAKDWVSVDCGASPITHIILF